MPDGSKWTPLERVMVRRESQPLHTNRRLGYSAVINKYLCFQLNLAVVKIRVKTSISLWEQLAYLPKSMNPHVVPSISSSVQQSNNPYNIFYTDGSKIENLIG